MPHRKHLKKKNSEQLSSPQTFQASIYLSLLHIMHSLELKAPRDRKEEIVEIPSTGDSLTYSFFEFAPFKADLLPSSLIMTEKIKLI